MASKLKQLKAFRNVAFDNLTTIYTLSQLALVETEHKTMFAVWYRQLDSFKQNFDANQTEIIIMVADKPDELEIETRIGADCLMKFVAIEAAYSQLFSLPSTQPPNLKVEQPQFSPFADKLKRIPLPTFNGNLRDWLQYRDLFIKLVHEKPYSDIEKYHFLVSSLSGEPLKIVKAIPICEGNYKIAFHSVLERYNNERSLATLYWNEIQNIPVMTAESSSGLRELLNRVKENSEALKLLKLTDTWEFVLFNIVVNKLDPLTRKAVEVKLDKRKIPTFADIEFLLNDHCLSLEAMAPADYSPGQLKSPAIANARHSSKPPSQTKTSFVATASNNSHKCILCPQSHSLFKCDKFKAKQPHERYELAKRHHLCFNCLSSGHGVPNCSSSRTCRSCNSRHHSLLHFAPKPAGSVTVSQASVAQTGVTPDPVTTCASRCAAIPLDTKPYRVPVLLGTAMLRIWGRFGQVYFARALIDSGSQISYISTRLADQLKLIKHPNSIPICGLGQSLTKCSAIVHSQIAPLVSNEPRINLELFVLDKICDNLPNVTIRGDGCLPRDTKLADPRWYESRPIQILLGADVYPDIMLPNQTSAVYMPDQPLLLDTIFGQVVLGPVKFAQPQPTVQSLVSSFFPPLDQLIEQFWHVEEIPTKPLVNPEEELAEASFNNSLYREVSGRFGVALPFKIQNASFEGSFEIANRRLRSLEKCFDRNPPLKALYVEFMQDYWDSGHMTPLDMDLPFGIDSYYLPHHGVFKHCEENVKIRVVFDASTKALNYQSLNDTLLVGPKLQKDIVELLLRFRFHLVAFTCDVRQMYRQILLQPSHRRYQLIRWRFSDSDPVTTFQLNTITYGVSSAPFLAIRTLLELATRGYDQFPLASQAIRSGLYVDDLICGASSIAEAKKIVAELIDLFALGCFELHKWSASHTEILESVPIENRLSQTLAFDGESSSTIKILGLRWQSSSDIFSFEVTPREVVCSKRTLLSELARIYDPLGFLGPISFFAKHLIQIIWLLGLDWDHEPPAEVGSQWSTFKAELPVLSSIKIPRLLFPPNVAACQLHGFCDASERGYAAVIYFRCARPDGSVYTSFVISKSKVAPIKQLSIPRLELCGAALLTKLVRFVLKTFSNIGYNDLFLWSDSLVVLGWIRSLPRQWKVFVSNKIAYIQEHIPSGCWRHVPSQYNPADAASRGLLPTQILSHSLWWSGPSFLLSTESNWPASLSGDPPFPVIERKPNKFTPVISSLCYVGSFLGYTTSDGPAFSLALLERLSSLSRLQNVVAYVLRFCHNIRYPNDKKIGPASHQERHQALLVVVRAVQFETFSDLFKRISTGKPLPRWVLKLSPMVGGDGLIRVGGRLENSALPYATKHPALLPKKHRLTELLVHKIHKENFHTGVNATLYLIQQNFWILSGRRSIRYYLSRCNRCFRVNPSAYQPPMGNLPAPRVNQVKPFSVVGCDFAGPFSVLLGGRRTRAARTTKAYLCIFVCFATKAVHLELASSLSTEIFIATLRRFIARRGRCSQIFSDCGTNFIGSNREFNRLMRHAADSELISWSFNPPSAPHFGGLWESGVKSAKAHFVKVVGKQLLTFEELYTLFVQIEAILNSRPLCSISSDPNDMASLTPGHFLTLEPLSAPPDPDLSHLQTSRLSRWQLIQQIQQSFWSRWRNEYLHNLYQKSKWASTKNCSPADIGTLVLIKDETMSPLLWKLGRIEELFPGTDGIARVASVRTTKGVLKRPLVKLCALPRQ